MRFNSEFRLALGFLTALGAVSSTSAAEQNPKLPSAVFIDVSKTAAPPERLPFDVGGTSKDGHVFSANTRYLMLDGKPWFPVMGEFHFTRYPEAEWELEILKMKAGGIQIVSTYVFWIHHE